MLLTFLPTVLITGASRGIGRATAKAFAHSGWDLLLISRSKTDLESLIDEIDIKRLMSSLNPLTLVILNIFLRE